MHKIFARFFEVLKFALDDVYIFCKFQKLSIFCFFLLFKCGFLSRCILKLFFVLVYLFLVRLIYGGGKRFYDIVILIQKRSRACRTRPFAPQLSKFCYFCVCDVYLLLLSGYLGKKFALYGVFCFDGLLKYRDAYLKIFGI